MKVFVCSYLLSRSNTSTLGKLTHQDVSHLATQSSCCSTIVKSDSLNSCSFHLGKY